MKTMMLAAVLSTGATVALADTADGDALRAMTWDQVVQEARGGTVNWFMWGGADNINAYVSDTVGGILARDYGITLNRVSIADTAEAVNQVLGEKEAGVTDAGSVDLIWINGENFRTMKTGGMVWCGYTDVLPNNALVNWDNPAIANDFGVPVDGCEVPWSRAQFAFAYDAARVPSPPQTMPALIEWIKANPGQFTYPAPPDFNGEVFIRHVFYQAAGGADALLGPFDQARFDAAAAKTWTILNDLEPYLWREGQTYPANVAAMDQLFANGEVAFSFNYEAAQFGVGVTNGTFPETVRTYGLTDGTIGNTNYTLIPFNSPNKAAAMVVQNLLLSGEMQLAKADPAVWGATPAIEVARTGADVQAGFAGLPSHPSVVSAQVLGAHALPELQADWIAAIAQGWQANVAP
jgi:putative spermidine/putrescine transport system substrate-binding protein